MSNEQDSSNLAGPAVPLFSEIPKRVLTLSPEHQFRLDNAEHFANSETLTRIEHATCIEGDYAPDSPDDTRHPVERRVAAMQADLARIPVLAEEIATLQASLKATANPNDGPLIRLDNHLAEKERWKAREAQLLKQLNEAEPQAEENGRVNISTLREEDRSAWILHIDRVLAGAREAGAIDNDLQHELDFRLKRYGEQHGQPAENAYRAAHWSKRHVAGDLLARLEGFYCEPSDHEGTDGKRPLERRIIAWQSELNVAKRDLDAAYKRADKAEKEVETLGAVCRLAKLAEDQLTAERAEARAETVKAAKALMQAHGEIKALRAELLGSQGAVAALALLLREAHRGELRAEDALQRATAEPGEQKASAG